MNDLINLNKYNLKYKILKDLYTFLSQSIYIKNINFNNLNNISSFEKCKCLIISKNISIYLKNNKIFKINNSILLKIINGNITNKNNIKLYKKNIELIKIYTILFTEKSCSHLSFYLFNNSKLSMINENIECLSIIVEKNSKHSIILNEHLNIFIKKNIKHKKGELFLYKNKKHLSLNLKSKIYLTLFSIIITYFMIFNIPNNYIIMEMNLTMHMKMNHNGYILSYRPKTKSARTMIKQNKQIMKKIDHSIPSFINYGIKNNILKPGQDVKIYIIGPPLNKKSFNKLKDSLKDIPLNIIINNSGDLIKINST